MTTRRSFIKGLAALPLFGAVKPTVAEPKPELDATPDTQLICCPHCFELCNRDHMCEGYRVWLEEHKEG